DVALPGGDDLDLPADDPDRRVADGDSTVPALGPRVRLMQLAQIAEDVGRPRPLRGGQNVLGAIDAGQYESRVDADAGRAHDVGVEPVSDEQRLRGGESRDRLFEDR